MKKIFNHCRLLQQVPIHLPSGICTSLQDHQPSLWTLHSWRCSNHCDVQQWPSIQWRWIQKVCSGAWLHAYHIIISFPPIQWFHWGQGEEGQECLQENWWISQCSSKSITSAMRHPILTGLPSPAEILHGWPAQGTVLSRPSKWINICLIST